MPDSQHAEQAFLTAFKLYLDFRLGEKGMPQEAPANVTGFIKRFELFLETRPDAQNNRDAFDDLVAKMSDMKTTRGTGTPPPKKESPDR